MAAVKRTAAKKCGYIDAASGEVSCMWVSRDWRTYELLDATGGERLERWGEFVLRRPDPQVLWKTGYKHPRWETPDAVYTRSGGGGAWSQNTLPASWTMEYKDLLFNVKPMNFKHTGLFPEQAVNWDVIRELIEKRGKPLKLLNLFAYTGAATVAAAKAGAKVTHVDAAKGMAAWAGENVRMNGVQARFLVDDCRKLVEREIRRGNTYDAIIMDPPSFGRGPGGEVWKLEDSLFDFLTLSLKLLSKDCVFVFVNSYTTGLPPSVLMYMLESVYTQRFGGKTEARELGLPVSTAGLILPCGATGRWIR